MIIRQMEIKDIDSCAKICLDAYSKEPWNENHDLGKVKDFLGKFTSNNIYIGWVICSDNQIIGFVVGIVIPSIGDDYFRIEDICISSDMQGKGIGSIFMKGLAARLKDKNMDSIILNTIMGFPAYNFYLKNGFIEIDSSSTMVLEI